MQIWERFFGDLRNAFKSLSYRTIFALSYIALGIALAGTTSSGVALMVAETGISPTGYGIVLALAGAVQLQWRGAPALLLSLPLLGLCIAIIHYLDTRTDAAVLIAVIVIAFWLISQRAAMDDQP